MLEPVADVLRALADLSPARERHAAGEHIVPLEWFRWLPARSVGLLLPPSETNQNLTSAVGIDRAFGERLAAVDQLRAEQHALRLGWLFVAGRAPDGGRVFHPLLTMPVRVARSLAASQLLSAGDLALSPLIADAAKRWDLEHQVEIGGGALADVVSEAIPGALLTRLDRLRRFALDAAAAAGFRAGTVVPGGGDPEELAGRVPMAVVAGIAVYAVHHAPTSVSRAGSLLSWAGVDDDAWTAFHTLYAPGEPPRPEPPEDMAVRSPYPLTPAQAEAVASSRTEPITVVSGAPGTGKSHTIAAIACNALAHNERVLVAAKSDATVDALIDLLDAAPGASPVVFGSSERRQALATRLAGGHLKPRPDDVVARSWERMRATIGERDALAADIAGRLNAEALLDEGTAGLAAARAACPALFEAGTDVDQVTRLVAWLSRGRRGWRARRKRRNLEWLTGADPACSLADIARAVEVARNVTTAHGVTLHGGLEIGVDWDVLADADLRARQHIAAWLAAQSESSARLNRTTLPALAALGTALRSGRAARRTQLQRLTADRLTRALPLWIGTLADVDDLLPQEPACFDLVILDEASSIDQPLAASALLRGARAVVVGDPQQLRHVSLTSDEEIDEALRDKHVDPTVAARLDVRRNSAFDVAAAVAPVVQLDEHYRSNPHLVEFVSRRLYGGVLKVATRSPRTENVDCIDVVRVDGHRDSAGVVQDEVDAVLDRLRRLRVTGASSVAVVSPFRAQADALEAAVLAAFHADDLEALDLRVGTVHAMQGNERDVVVASIGIGPQDAGAWRFVDDPHLFAVLVTRARDHFVVVHSADPPAGGLLADYLAQADSPPGPPAAVVDAPVTEWARAIAADLAAAGLSPRLAYPTGRHVVDLCVGDDRRAVSIECAVHPDGGVAHVERHLALRRAGWDLVDAYHSRWGARRGELAVELAARLTST